MILAMFALAPVGPAPSSTTNAARGGLNRATYDAKGSEFPKGGLGDLVRSEGQGATGDKAVDAAHDNAGLVYEFYKTVLGRDFDRRRRHADQERRPLRQGATTTPTGTARR